MRELNTTIEKYADIHLVTPEEGLCRSCRTAPAAYYVTRHGVYLPNLCYRCWKKGDPEASNRRNYGPGNATVLTGRS